MERSLFFRALAIGLICFFLALAGFYLIFSWESWRYSQLTFYSGGYPQTYPFEGRNIFLTVTLAIVIELILLPILAGSVMALVLPAKKVTKNDLFRYAGLAGAIPLSLISIIFWAMFIASLIRTISGGNGQIVLGQAWFYILGMCLNVLIILAAAFASAVSCQSVWTIRRKVVNRG